MLAILGSKFPLYTPNLNILNPPSNSCSFQGFNIKIATRNGNMIDQVLNCYIFIKNRVGSLRSVKTFGLIHLALEGLLNDIT